MLSEPNFYLTVAQACATLAIVLLTKRLVQTTERYTKETGLMAAQMTADATEAREQVSRSAAQRLYQGILSLEAQIDVSDGARGRATLDAIWRQMPAVMLADVLFLRDKALQARLNTLQRLVIDAGNVGMTLTNDNWAVFRVVEAFKAIRRDLAAHVRGENLEPSQLPHEQRTIRWLNAPWGAKVEAFQTDD